MSSAGNTRGLIEAPLCGERCHPRRCLPRGIPAASLKRAQPRVLARARPGLPRGIPAASLKPLRPRRRAGGGNASSAGNTRGLIEARTGRGVDRSRPYQSSAGNTRGLIEALRPKRASAAPSKSSAGNTRGLIEAPGCPAVAHPHLASSAGNTRGLIEACAARTGAGWRRGLPRGIPAASLKPRDAGRGDARHRAVFRGEYPRPH